MQAIILAGGMGTCLIPLTLTCPKPLLPIANKPLLEYQLQLLKSYGIKHITISTNYLGDLIKEHFEDGSRFGVKIDYAEENEPMGSGGAIKNAENLIHDKDVIVLHGDIITDINIFSLYKFHRLKKADITLLFSSQMGHGRSNSLIIDDENRVKGFNRELDQNIYNFDSGIYIINRDLFELIPVNKKVSIEEDMIPILLKSGLAVYGFPVDVYYRFRVKTPDNYLKTNIDMIQGIINCGKNNEFCRGIMLGEDVKIAPQTKLISPVVLGDNVEVGSGAEIGPFVVVGDNCSLEPDTKISRSVILGNSIIEKGVKLKGCIIDRFTLVSNQNHF